MTLPSRPPLPLREEDRLLAPFAAMTIADVLNADVRCFAANDTRTIEADFDAGGEHYRYALIFRDPLAFTLFAGKLTAALHQRHDADQASGVLDSPALSIHPSILAEVLAIPHAGVCDECHEGSPNAEGEAISIRAFHASHVLFYHPSCAAEHTWAPGEIVEGVLPS
jgi:hypothetical protein